jgi:hypothetical protein
LKGAVIARSAATPRVSKHEATVSPVAILRDARKRAPQDEDRASGCQ